MIAQRELPLGRWLAQHTPTCGRCASGRETKRPGRQAGLVLELALLLILALWLPGARKRK